MHYQGKLNAPNMIKWQIKYFGQNWACPGKNLGKIVKMLHNLHGHQMITSCEFPPYLTMFEWFIEFGDRSESIYSDFLKLRKLTPNSIYHSKMVEYGWNSQEVIIWWPSCELWRIFTMLPKFLPRRALFWKLRFLAICSKTALPILIILHI